ncbi:hypothetical protein BSL78_04423 [Apostichopus japonicus]|uniref:Uncharacterized protein n=1 Tax=Stichopus japonicus TaxID=307972 RepID=A0A2G8LEG0_STIJA|nr:hypothetical protein BSL78_04423 [Apostichopus japonicus]
MPTAQGGLLQNGPFDKVWFALSPNEIKNDPLQSHEGIIRCSDHRTRIPKERNNKTINNCNLPREEEQIPTEWVEPCLHLISLLRPSGGLRAPQPSQMSFTLIMTFDQVASNGRDWPRQPPKRSPLVLLSLAPVASWKVAKTFDKGLKEARFDTIQVTSSAYCSHLTLATPGTLNSRKPKHLSSEVLSVSLKRTYNNGERGQP